MGNGVLVVTSVETTDAVVEFGSERILIGVATKALNEAAYNADLGDKLLGLYGRVNDVQGFTDHRAGELTREDSMKIQLFASGSLALGGLILMGMGLYFGFLRPPLLPEDLRYMGASLTEIQSAIPGLQPWLARVFGVLGGYVFATGLLTVYVAVAGFRTGRLGAIAVVSVSGLASIGWMVTTNFLIGSDFKWLLLVFALPWVFALVLSWVSERRLSGAGE